jgi:hypothetical protein
MVNDEQSLSMAWVVEWHFLHQSRNRAIASRRFFNSTRSRSARQRLLDRTVEESAQLPADWAKAVQRVANAMGRGASTAGWALHLIMNVQATAGEFEVEDLDAIKRGISSDDPGLITAAITYIPSRDLREAVRPLLEEDSGCEALLAALGDGIEIGGIRVRPPRFLTTDDSWSTVRKLWNVKDDKIWEYFNLEVPDHWHLLENLRAAAPDVIAKGLSEDSVQRALDHVERGDTRPYREMSEAVTLRRAKAGDWAWLLTSAALWFDEHPPAEDREG